MTAIESPRGRPAGLALRSVGVGVGAPGAAARPAGEWLSEARDRERAGCIPEAVERYDAAVAAAEAARDPATLAEALRRLAVLRHRRDEPALARELVQRSLAVARGAGHDLLEAEALNSLGVMDLMTGSLADARRNLLAALALGGAARGLHARVEQNLGIVANIQGDLEEARSRYERSLDAYRAAGDEPGCAIAFHNLGMVSADRQRYDDAERHFAESLTIAERAGDAHLQALCLVNRGEVLVARERYEAARHDAEAALALFDQLGARGAKATAYRVLGMVYRETGKHALAESRLRSAIELAVAAGSVLNEAEASRELALLYQAMGRNQEALRLLNAAHRLFRRLDARADLVHVDGKVEELEGTYRAVVRDWGQSIESSDSYTYGHCERVAERAAAVARALGLDEEEITALVLGAYLHDVGKVKIPHEVLNKPGPLTREEMALVQMHPIWGLELLASVEFPWDLKPIIRWHHEKYDGSGYPDRLKGDEIPLAAQIVGIVDVYDALTTARPYKRALSAPEATAEITACRRWWSDRVYEAFMGAVGGSGPVSSPHHAGIILPPETRP